MDRKDFGKLIIALRREQIDKSQSKPWTRQKLSEETAIDEEILANIETGRRALLGSDLLTQIANSLQMNSAERKEFFLAASGVDEEKLYSEHDTPQKALEEMLELMDQLQQPAFLVDQYFDIVAVNLMVLELYGVDVNDFVTTEVNPVTRVNLMRFLFSPEFKRQKAMFGKKWDKFAASNVSIFRGATLRYRAGKYYQRLIENLLEFDDFKSYYQRIRKIKSETYIDNNLYIQLETRLGPIRCISTSVTASTTAGELRLYIFTPIHSDTVKNFLDLAKHSNFVFQTLPSWPLKNEIEENIK